MLINVIIAHFSFFALQAVNDGTTWSGKMSGSFDGSNNAAKVFDGDLSTFMNYKDSLHPKSTMAKLRKAVWPDETERASKTTSDLEGQSVNVNVFHEETKIDGRSVTYAEFRFTRIQ